MADAGCETGATFEEKREGEGIGKDGRSESEGIEKRESGGGVAGVGENTEGGVEREDTGADKEVEKTRSELGRIPADEAGGKEIILVGPASEDSGVDLL